MESSSKKCPSTYSHLDEWTPFVQASCLYWTVQRVSHIDGSQIFLTEIVQSAVQSPSIPLF